MFDWSCIHLYYCFDMYTFINLVTKEPCHQWPGALISKGEAVNMGFCVCMDCLIGSFETPLLSNQLTKWPHSPQVRPHGTTPYCSDLLNDGGCVALLVVGFLLVTPLLVLALAAYCRLARHLQLGLCFIPYSRAVYKNLPANQHHGLGSGCCGGGSSKGGAEGGGKGKVWVWDVSLEDKGRTMRGIKLIYKRVTCIYIFIIKKRWWMCNAPTHVDTLMANANYWPKSILIAKYLK